MVRVVSLGWRKAGVPSPTLRVTAGDWQGGDPAAGVLAVAGGTPSGLDTPAASGECVGGSALGPMLVEVAPVSSSFDVDSSGI